MLDQPVRQRIELQRRQAQAPVVGRLRGVHNADQARRRQIKFPAGIELTPGDRVYGIDATRSALINSYGNQHRRELYQLDKLRKNGAVSPLKINPLNDGWLSDIRGSELAPSYYRGFAAEYIDYKGFIAGFPEVENLRETVEQAQGIRKDADLRRRTFGLLSKAGINFAYDRGHTIFYGLDDMSLENAFNPESQYYATVSSQEMRHIYAHREALCHNEDEASLRWNAVRFIRDGKEVLPPWAEPQKRGYFAGVSARLQRRGSFGEMSPERAMLRSLFGGEE